MVSSDSDKKVIELNKLINSDVDNDLVTEQSKRKANVKESINASNIREEYGNLPREK